ncbi:MAG: nitroreductase family protein [Elusimicrobiaceae bacterium]|nr:nitroreductase family protein [Elusimicrobiaceae bacterium]
MTFTELARARYSVRKFADKPIESEKLNAVLQAARLAPTAKNLQAYHIYVVQSPEGMEKMRTLTPCHYGAPVVLIFTKDTQQEWHHPQEPQRTSGVQDASIVATHVMFAATEQGLGTCWLNFFSQPAVSRAYHLPAHEIPVLLMPIGYVADDCAPADRHQERKELDDLVTYL